MYGTSSFGYSVLNSKYYDKIKFKSVIQKRLDYMLFDTGDFLKIVSSANLALRDR